MRIWQTLGDVYRNIKKPSTALACYKRSLSASEVIAPGTLASIAKIYAGMKSNEKDAATWYQLFMEDGRGSEEDSEAACIYLAHYYMDQRDFKKTVWLFIDC